LAANTDVAVMGEKIKEPVYEIANLAHNHLNWGRKVLADVPKEAIPAFLFTVSIVFVL
jgi:hypothetical protein